MKRHLLLGLVIALAAPAAWASAREDEGPIRTVTYDPDEVVTIEGEVGVALHLVLEAGERYVTHAFGDGKAWDFAVHGNHYFVKPVVADAASNLALVTDRRSYHLLLKLQKGGRPPALEVVFRYREKGRQAHREATRRREVEGALSAPSKASNTQYSMSGDLDIAPVNAWDDRTFTYFRFAANRDIPAIYMVDADGEESIVNRHSSGRANDVVVVHRVAARWTLRLGSRALAVFNDAFDASGRKNVTGTSSPDVTRVLWSKP
jgi:type IV secretion system protein VirB9